ncbi:uncharacterized protein J4E78_007068 [Alternaria triticimaculans]|uniref:uncharacterized protein n=1 Tax=Alternaria triticimaculans TaxID=297637 RepID=UPI0020C35C50|nr:uncharacterized protein J4E78_007068 [Alternaria triticimaculans]KAI4654890.1 hypothetical protein J4E78_007068 [Alternaria triticimaculans]
MSYSSHTRRTHFRSRTTTFNYQKTLAITILAITVLAVTILPDKMADQLTQIPALVTPTLQRHNKRRRSTSIAPEQAVFLPGASPSNDENDPTTTPHGQRHPDDTTIHKRTRKAHGSKRRRIAGDFTPVHSPGSPRSSDLKEAPSQIAPTASPSSIDPVSGGHHPHQDITALPVDDTPSQLKSITDTIKHTLGRDSKKKFKVWEDEPQPSKPKDPTPAAAKLLQDITNTGAQRRCRRVEGHTPQFRAQEADYYYHPNLKDFQFPQGVVASTEEAVEEAAPSERHALTTEANRKTEDAQLEVTQSLKRKADDDLRERGAEKLKKLNNQQPLPWIVHGKIRHDPVQDFETEYFAISTPWLPSEPVEDVVNTTEPDQSQQEIDAALEAVEPQQLPTPISEPVSNEVLSPPIYYNLNPSNIVHVQGDDEPALDKLESGSLDLDAILMGMTQEYALPTVEEDVSKAFGTYKPPTPQDDDIPAGNKAAFAGFGTYQPPPQAVAAASPAVEKDAFKGFGTYKPPPPEDNAVRVVNKDAFEGFGVCQPPPQTVAAAPQPAPKIVTTVPSLIDRNNHAIINTGAAYSEGYDPGNPHNFKHYLAQFTDRPAIPRPREREYRPMPEVLEVETLNQRLDWVVPNGAEAPHLFRDMTAPPPHIDSELARCVRFAQSDAQRRVNWRAHPTHVAEIMQRTNFYGMELLVSRSEMRISSPPTADEFELAMATRLAQISFGMDTKDYIAADVPAIMDYFRENLPSAISVFPTEEEDCFRAFTDYYRVMFEENYPPLNALGLPEWQVLLDAEEGKPSLKAQTLQGIVQSIKGLTSHCPGDADGTNILKDGVSHEKPNTGNEHLDNARLELAQALGVSRIGVTGDVQWPDQPNNASFPSVAQREQSQHYDANQASYWNNTEAPGGYVHPFVPETDARVQDVHGDYHDPEGWFRAELNAPIPWDSGLDAIPSGFSAVPLDYGAIEEYFNPSAFGAFNDAEPETLL